MASTLRRRVLDAGGAGAGATTGSAAGTPSTETPSSTESSAAPSPATMTPVEEKPDDSSARPGEKVKVIHHQHPQKTRKRRNTFIFLLGSLFGIFVAGLLAKNNDLITLPEISDLSMDSLLDVLPASLAKDMRDFRVCEQRDAKPTLIGRRVSPSRGPRCVVSLFLFMC